MTYFVIGSRFHPGPPASFVTGGPPEMPFWSTIWEEAFKFETAEFAALYLQAMAERRPAYLEKYGVFEATPPNRWCWSGRIDSLNNPPGAGGLEERQGVNDELPLCKLPTRFTAMPTGEPRALQ